MSSESPLARLTHLFAVVTLPAGILAALFISLPVALAVFVVGWLLLTPASAILFGPPTPGPSGSPEPVEQEIEGHVREQIKQRVSEKIDEPERSKTDPVEEIRRRYAQGEIDEAELEQRLDALLELEEIDPDDKESIERAVRNLDTDERGAEPATGDEQGADSEHTQADTDLVSDRE